LHIPKFGCEIRGVENYLTTMITPHEFRQFSVECLRWADEAPNPSDRQIILSVAKQWLQTAFLLEREELRGTELVDDLRRKLD